MDSYISCNLVLKNQSNIGQTTYKLCSTIQKASWATRKLKSKPIFIYNKDNAFAFANHLAKRVQPIPATINYEDHDMRQFLEKLHIKCNYHTEILQ